MNCCPMSVSDLNQKILVLGIWYVYNEALNKENFIYM